ncbi:SPOR domain-containing protein [Sessilibacter corallicola]|uniref:SPOR domain-containing protein n=1 Tax=Sessilibacter corallicola TaxID=2904075 RepID=A0ABQ0A5F9_9GAMM
MTRDFAKKSKPSPKRKNNNRRAPSKPERKLSGWVWLLSGAVIGAFAMFLVYLSGLAPTPSQSPNPPAKTVERSNNNGQQNKPEEVAVPKPRLEFYQLLKESEVEVPEPTTTENQNSGSLANNQQYLLQAGSFQKLSDADRMRAQLILMNLDAAIEDVTLDNKQVWHRVVVGPFDNRSQMSAARATLVSNDISPLVLKRPRP